MHDYSVNENLSHRLHILILGSQLVEQLRWSRKCGLAGGSTEVSVGFEFSKSISSLSFLPPLIVQYVKSQSLSLMLQTCLPGW